MQYFLNRITLYCLLGASLFLGFNAIRVVSFITLGDVFLFSAAGLSLIQAVTGQRTSVFSPGIPFLLSLVLFTLALGISLPQNEGTSAAANLGEYIKLVLGLFLVPYLFADLVRNELWLERIIHAFVISAAISASIGLSEFLGYEFADSIGAVSITGESLLTTGRARGLTLHPNFLALTCVVAMPLAWMLQAKARLGRAWKFLAVGLCFVGVVAGGSRAALLAAVATGLILFLATTSSKQKVQSFAISFVVIIFLAIALRGTAIEEYLVAIVALKRLIDGIGGDSSVTDSDNERLEYVAVASENIDSYPLQGAGFEWIQHAHNIYIQVFEAAGLFGAIAFLAYLYGFARIFCAAYKCKQAPAMLLGSALSVSAYLISGLAANSLYTRPIVLPFAFLWAAAAITLKRADKSNTKTSTNALLGESKHRGNSEARC